MSSVEEFLLRTSLSDTGALPRSGMWTNCPDICIGGARAIAQDTLIQSYDEMFDNALTQGQLNNIYARAKNMTSAPLSQKVFLFQFPNSLVLKPDLWYAKAHLVGCAPPDGAPTDNQVISADPGDIAATRAFSWTPDSAENHCLVSVVADSWEAALSHYPAGVGSMDGDGLAMWIYANGNLGWRSVNILAKP